MYPRRASAQGERRSWHYCAGMARTTRTSPPVESEPRVRRGYFECRYGQLHVHNAIPWGGGFEEGTPLLCLHDLPGSGRTFTAFLALAGRDRSVYAPDLPGSGESDPPAAAATLADHAAALGDFLESLRLRQVDVLGYGAGVPLALELALERPAQVRRLVLVPLRADAVATPPFSREKAARIAQPVLVLRPREGGGEAAGKLRDLLPSARLADLPGTGPDLFRTAPAAVAEAVRGFLRS
jgi:pimeloyl-ACP methyl ester carboxylesterase